MHNRIGINTKVSYDQMLLRVDNPFLGKFWFEFKCFRLNLKYFD